jgi:myo-inositol-1-phosphate synthase
VGGLKVSDVKIVGAFDIDARKVGRDLADALGDDPNSARLLTSRARTGVRVNPGLMQGDPPPHLSGLKTVTAELTDVIGVLEKSGADIVLNLISSGSDRSSAAYAEAALKADCSFVNCTPTLFMNNKSTLARFRKNRRVIVGDDLMSQLGGTILHRGILKLLVGRGLKVSRSYQLDVGGSTETFNTLNEEIKMAKRSVKTESIISEVPYKFDSVAGTTDYVDYLGNNRTSYFWIEGTGFLGSPTTVDMYLRYSDAPNAGNIILDVVRAVEASVKRRDYGAIQEICAYGFKRPPQKMHFDEACLAFERRFL